MQRWAPNVVVTGKHSPFQVIKSIERIVDKNVEGWSMRKFHRAFAAPPRLSTGTHLQQSDDRKYFAGWKKIPMNSTAKIVRRVGEGSSRDLWSVGNELLC